MKGGKEMKKQYEHPMVVVEGFVPNEYIAACYNIKCNVPYGYGYLDNNRNGEYDRGDTKLATGEGCGTYHTASGLPETLTANAMWHTNNSRRDDVPVFWWRQNTGHTDPNHFTLMNKIEWDKNPNAS